jgi:glycosyltransferase involved in cell wall biosynthesis
MPPMRILADIRCLQDENYAGRGVGSHAACLLEAIRDRIGTAEIIGLVDPAIGEVDHRHKGLCDTLRPAFVSIDASTPTILLSLSPMTHDTRLPAMLIDRPNVFPVAVVYDFIPLEFPQRYLAAQAAKFAYAAATTWLAAHRAFFPISEHSGHELVRRLHVARRDVHVTGVALRPSFASLLAAQPTVAVPADAADETMLFVGGPDPRKNLETVVEAHARLVAAGRNLELVVAGGYPQAWRDQCRGGPAAERIRFLDRVDDEELAGWYRHARVTVSASMAEGFSMPVVEAAACGGLSLVSDIPAHRELVDDAACRFAASDACELAAKAAGFLDDPAARERAAGRQRAAAMRFTAEAVGGRFMDGLLERFEQFARRPRRSRRRAIAVVTPFPPDRSGVADYSMRSIEALAEHVDVDVYTDQPEPIACPAVRAFHPISSAAWLRPDYDTTLAVVGNSHFHTRIIELHQRFGGPCLIHDNRLAELTAWWKGADYLRAIAERSLDRPVKLHEVREWLADPGQLPSMFYEEVIDKAFPLLVHSRGIQESVSQIYGIEAAYLPFCLYRNFSSDEIAEDARRHARAALGVSPGELMIVTLGLVDAVKSPQTCIDAVARLRAAGHDAQLHFVGESAAIRDELTLQARSAGIDRCVHFSEDWLPEEDYRRYLVAADLGIQLRNHFFGGLSGALLDCIAAGLPTVANRDLAEALESPGYVVRVPDRPDAASLAAGLEEAARLGSRAATEPQRLEFAGEHSFVIYAERLLELLVEPATVAHASNTRHFRSTVGA